MIRQPTGYIALLRRNKPFRRLWYGQVVSQLESAQRRVRPLNSRIEHRDLDGTAGAMLEMMACLFQRKPNLQESIRKSNQWCR